MANGVAAMISLPTKSTAVRLTIANEFDYDDVTFATETLENLVNFRNKAIKE